MVRQAAIVALMSALIVGCGKGTGEDMKGKVGDVKDKVKDTAENVWSGQTKAIDKARSVGKTVMDAAEAQRRKIEKDSE